jgi:hypothetical protein
MHHVPPQRKFCCFPRLKLVQELRFRSLVGKTGTLLYTDITNDLLVYHVLSAKLIFSQNAACLGPPKVFCFSGSPFPLPLQDSCGVILSCTKHSYQV